MVERSGVLNLGVEGIMIAGADSGVAAAIVTGSSAIGVAAAVASGMALSALVALLTPGLSANEVSAGLAVTIFGPGRICRRCARRSGPRA